MDERGEGAVAGAEADEVDVVDDGAVGEGGADLRGFSAPGEGVE